MDTDPEYVEESEDTASDDDFFVPPTSIEQILKNRVKRHGGGRIKDKIWEQYMELANFPGTWACKWCEWTVKKPKMERLKKHFEMKCGRKLSNKTKNIPLSTKSNAAVVFSSPRQPIQNIGKTQTKIKSFFGSTSIQEQTDLHRKLMKFICSSNIPFRIVENPYFLEFVKSLRPSYNTPTQKQVGSTLLDELYDETSLHVVKKIQGKIETIIQDGWTTNQHEAVIAHSLYVEGEVFFIDAIVTEEEKKDAANCLRRLTNCMENTETKYGVTIVGCITDNCSTMELMKRRLVEQNSSILAYGCNSHLLNLVGKNKTPEDIKNKIVEVHKYFRNHDFAAASLKKLNGPRPPIPGDTRWNSQLDCFRCYNVHQTKYLEVSRKDANMPLQIKEILNDASVFPRLAKALSVLEPIGCALDTVRISTFT